MTDEAGIHTIDTGFVRPGFDAAYLVTERGHAACIDSGTTFSVPRILDGIRAAGLTPAAVDWLILTHVHLDHAGGAGALIAQLPNARLAVHPRGARHMIDPTRLWASASAVYGADVMERTYGRLVPVPAERVHEVADEEVIDLAGRALRCLHTPGHARHHIAIQDTRTGCCFTGDVFGLSYRDFDTSAGPFVLPTTSPVQFDPDALHASIRRLVALRPPAMYPTHFGRIEAVARLAEDLHAQIDAMTALAEVADERGDRHPFLLGMLTELYARRAAEHGWRGGRGELAELLHMDVELNAQGLEVWMDQRRAAVR